MQVLQTRYHKINFSSFGTPCTSLYGQFMVIAGLGHLEYRFGVPERVDKHNIVSEDETVIISVRDVEDVPNDVDIATVGRVETFPNKYPADYIYLYEIEQDNIEDEDVKKEISEAYDKVGATAKLTGKQKWL